VFISFIFYSGQKNVVGDFSGVGLLNWNAVTIYEVPFVSFLSPADHRNSKSYRKYHYDSE